MGSKKIVLLLGEKLMYSSLVQWGIDDIDLMKLASSAGVDTFLRCGPSLVCSIRKIGMLVGACAGSGEGVSRWAGTTFDLWEKDEGSEMGNSVRSAGRRAEDLGSTRGGGGQ